MRLLLSTRHYTYRHAIFLGEKAMKTLLQSVTKPEGKKANQQTLYFTLFTNLDSKMLF